METTVVLERYGEELCREEGILARDRLVFISARMDL